jgi:hypothetical protein
VSGQQAGEELDDMARDIERGSIGDQASGSADDLVRETCPTRGFTPSCDGNPRGRPRQTAR